jgi:hypothetical protein
VKDLREAPKSRSPERLTRTRKAVRSVAIKASMAWKSKRFEFRPQLPPDRNFDFSFGLSRSAPRTFALKTHKTCCDGSKFIAIYIRASLMSDGSRPIGVPTQNSTDLVVQAAPNRASAVVSSDCGAEINAAECRPAWHLNLLSIGASLLPSNAIKLTLATSKYKLFAIFRAYLNTN